MHDGLLIKPLAATLAVLACGVAGCGGSSSSSSSKPAANSTPATTTPKRLLLAGQACSAANQRLYSASALQCVSGHLQKPTSPTPGSSTSTSGGASSGSH